MPESCVCCYKILWKLCGGACPQCSHGSPAYELMKTGPYLTFFFHLGRACKVISWSKKHDCPAFIHCRGVWGHAPPCNSEVSTFCTCTFHSEAYIAKYPLFTHALNFPTCWEFRVISMCCDIGTFILPYIYLYTIDSSYLHVQHGFCHFVHLPATLR